MDIGVNPSRQLNAEERKAYFISPVELRRLHMCKQSFEFSRLGILYPGNEFKQFFLSAASVFKSLLGTIKNPQEELENYFSNTKQEWFSCVEEERSQRERGIVKLMRVYHYIQSRNLLLKGVDVDYSFSFPQPINYKEKLFSDIRGKFDFVFENCRGERVAVFLRYGAPEESYCARKEVNKVENSLPLLAATLGARSLFQEDCLVEEWYLKNKDDNGSVMMEEFEHRKGKNVITADFSDMDNEQLLERIFFLLGQPCECDCDACRHQAACKVDTNPRMEESSISSSVRVQTEMPEFTCSQEEVITHVNGPMCAIAVPGAGKTTALVERTVYLVEKCHVKPQRILLVAFTKKAADEIRDRVAIRLAASGIKKMPTIATYHALGFSILKEHPLHVGTRIHLATDIDRYNLIFDALEQVPKINGRSYVNPKGEYGIVRFLDSMFEEIQESGIAVFREKYQERFDVDGICTCYEEYRRRYEARGFINYDDQIEMVNELFESYPTVARKCSDKYEYIMIDEFQDSSEEQVEMVYAIAKPHGNIVVVGDDDQSIYKWRGGSSRFMLEFQKDFPTAKMCYMEDNFRSYAGILALCNALIAKNGARYEKKLVAHYESAYKPVYLKDVDRNYLQKVVIASVEHASQPGKVAILARSNKKLEEVGEILKGVCPVSIPKDFLIKDPVFLVLYDMLTLFYKGMNNDLSLHRLFKMMGQESILVKRKSKSLSFYQNMIELGELPPLEMTPECMEMCASSTDGLMACFSPLLTCFERIRYGQLHEALSAIVKEVLGADGHPVIERLMDLAEERGIVETKDLYLVMDNLIAFDSTERVGYDVNPDAVNLLTVHDAKGKEFETVIVYGMEDFSQDEEEVRVLYVALSRARKNLFMLETAYNRYEGFQRIAPYITVKGGCYHG